MKRFWIPATFGLAVVLLAANAGKILVVNDPRPSDIILVLAGETDRRPARALELLNQGYASRIVIDVPATGKVYGFTMVELAQRYVQVLPRASSIRVCPTEGLSTRDEAIDAGRCLAQEEGNRVLIVTSDFHTRRALSTFRRVLPTRSFSVAAAYDETQFGTHWWRHRQWAKTLVDEWLRLLWWNAVDRWR
ncbi:MAG TPA: YdcF family protein [Verrucomicrobiae bacterium]|nr:YdcF family protein [Verrucomicrobiae bacterium]